MTTSVKPQSLPRFAPETVAARTALANAGMGKSNMDPALLATCEAFCLGEAEFFGMPQTSNRGRQALVTLLAAFHVDAEAMESHYFTLVGE